MQEAGSQLAVLIVEDDDSLRGVLKRYLTSVGCDVRAAANLAEGREELDQGAVDLALVDYQLPDGSGDTLIKWALDEGRATAACCMTARATCGNVVQAMLAGSFDVLEKPFHLERLGAIVKARRPTAAADLHAWRLTYAPGIVGDDPELLEALSVTHNVADTDCTVLIGGESGSGKELVAKALHDASSRRNQPFVARNCGAITESLIESELFGHVKGSFTGANANREGAFVAAQGGTLFLDEIGDMPLSMQAKLLRVLQERQVTPVGADRAVPVDVRIVAATHRDLDRMVEEGAFRADLFYRLSVIRVELPPLRERTGDVLALARHFLDHENRRLHRTCTGFDEDAEEALLRHQWPGNVRELANTIERAVVLRGVGRITEKDLQLPRRTRPGLRAITPTSVPAIVPQAAPLPLHEVSASAAPPPPPGVVPIRRHEDSLNMKEVITVVERQLIQTALDRTGGNRAEAAALLGLNRTTLVEKIKKLGA